MEEWRPIKGFPNYLISSSGSVYNKKFNRKLKTVLDTKGYPTIGLNRDGNRFWFKVHRLVAETFCDGFHPDLQVNHIDGVKSNNDSTNLEWTTSSKNVSHAYKEGLKQPSGPHRIRPVKIIETGEIFKNASDAARYIKGDHSHVSKVLRGELQSHKGYTYEHFELNKKIAELLQPHQATAVDHLENGRILFGGVGSGKSLVAVAYYLKHEAPKDVYVVTTAKKRDSTDWQKEFASLGIGTKSEATLAGVLTVDSWNNIKNYVDVEDAFFIFDEQRLVGSGAWVKSFLKIAKKNRWIMLSATPGDTWLDYAPVFIANGFYKTITEFKYQHVMYEPYNKYPKIRMYLDVPKLERNRADVLVEMPYKRHTERHLNWMDVSYDKEVIKNIRKTRWNLFKDEPIKDASEMFRVMRKVVNMDPSRLDLILKLMEGHPRLIIFYNFNYELEILRTLELCRPTYEWNGHRKDDLPDSDEWVYLVQYVAGAEGWNCTTTDAMVFYSLPYSFKLFEQSQGRIDRLDTKFRDLYFYCLVSNSGVDDGIRRALMNKKNFNERAYLDENSILDDFEVEHNECCQI